MEEAISPARREVDAESSTPQDGRDDVICAPGFAPDSRSILTSARRVAVSASMESSMTTRRLPSMTSRSGLSLRRDAELAQRLRGLMKVRPT